MLRHTVMFKWNDETTDETKAAVAAGLDELASRGFALRHGGDVGISDGNWDYAVVGEFDDAAGYTTYATDADHVALIANIIKPAISARAAVQYQLD